MVIRLILFDIGNVLVELGDAGLIRRFSRRDFSDSYFWETWAAIPGVSDFESGKTDCVTFSKSVIAFYDLEISVDEFITVFRSGAKRKYSGVDEFLSLLAKTHALACLTNTNPIHWPKIKDEFELGKFFQRTYLSYEIGHMKPDAAIFRHVLDDTGFEAREILFVDDGINHIQCAESLGFKCCHVNSFEDARTKIALALTFGTED